MRHTVNNRITHINIRRCHINLCTQNLFSVFIFSFTHLFEQLKVFLYGAVAVWAVFPRLFQCTSVFTNLFRTQVTHVSLAFLDQFYRTLIHGIKIIRCKIKVLFKICPQPFHIFFNRLYKFCVFFHRICIVKSQMKCSIIFLRQSIIQQNRLGMSNMKISVRFRRKSGTNFLINPFT